MAVTVVLDMDNVTSEFYDAVVREMRIDEEPVAGLILHTAGMFGGRWREVETWESLEAFETFRRDRVAPAVMRLVPEGTEFPELTPEVMEVYDLVQ